MGHNLRILTRMVAVGVIGAAAGACSVLPQWANPFGSYDSTADESVAAPPADTAATTNVASDNPSQLSEDNSGTAHKTFPSVASVPEKPAPSATPTEREQLSDTLLADRERAQYSAEALRGGTEPAAAPPPAAPPQEISALEQQEPTDSNTAEPASESTSDIASSDSMEPTAIDSAAAAPPPAAAPAPPPAAEPAPAPQAQVASANLQSSDTAGTASSSAQGDIDAAETPAAEPPAARVIAASTRSPAAPIPGAQPGIPSDAPLAFNPSTAPPLDPSVAEFVPASVLERYQATSSEAQQMTGKRSLTTKRRSKSTGPGSANTFKQSSNSGSSVFVNYDAVNGEGGEGDAGEGGGGVVPVSKADAVVNTSQWRTPGRKPAAVVFFPANGMTITAEAKAEIRTVAQAYKARGNRGVVRVVGHAASRTANMPLQQHIAHVFKQSEQHAKAVAKVLISDGVPANALVVEAVGDTQPVYYESMPMGEDGNRRTEIFIEG